MVAPTDPNYYLAVAAMADRLGMKPEDFLFIGASETGLDPSSTGAARTTHTLMHDSVVPNLLTQAEWDALPMLDALSQLPYIERLYTLLHDKYIGGRSWKDTLEVYLANAAPGLLRPDGRYNPNTVMYGNPNQPANSTWAANWPMDNYPAGATYVNQGLDAAKALVSQGTLKGWITLGDLKAFAMRPNGIANDAIDRLHTALLQAKAQQDLQQQPMSGFLTWVPASYDPSGSAGGYAPDASQSFSDPSAPVDTRQATDTAQGAESVIVSGLRYGALAGAVWLLWRWRMKL